MCFSERLNIGRSRFFKQWCLDQKDDVHETIDDHALIKENHVIVFEHVYTHSQSRTLATTMHSMILKMKVLVEFKRVMQERIRMTIKVQIIEISEASRIQIHISHTEPLDIWTVPFMSFSFD